MKTQLILVEGLPGTGKTTLAGRIAAYAKDLRSVDLYRVDFVVNRDMVIWDNRHRGDDGHA